jgi:hypothetical protein
MTSKQKAPLSVFVMSLLLLCTSPAIAAQNGGGKQNGGGTPTGPIPQIAGDYSGQVVAGAPVAMFLANMSLTEDSAGNLSGTICIQECSSLSGKASGSPFFPFGVFQFRAGDNQFSGIVEGSVTCKDGRSARWVAGSFQSRGETSTFSFTTCQ